jgi:SsrA-binding protein
MKALYIMSVLLINKKARFEYEVLESFQAGLVLSGKMTKLIRNRKVVLQNSYIVLQKSQLQIIGFGNEELTENVTLLLNKNQKAEIISELSQKGIACVPLNIKTVGRWLKAEIALVRGKKQHDKKESLKKRDIDREISRDLKSDRFSE